MGLFDKFFKKPAATASYTPSSEGEAWLAVLCACLLADGDLEAAEAEKVQEMLTDVPKLADVDFFGLWRKIHNAESEVGGLGLIKAAAPFIKEDKEQLFGCALKIIMADGTIDEGETKIMLAISAELNISADESTRMINEYLQELKDNVL